MLAKKATRMANRKKIKEGKTKVLYRGPEPGTLIQYFKDDITAFNNLKKDKIEGRGILNNRISAHIMTKLSECNVPTHFIKRINMREQLVHEVDIIPVEVIVRNIAAGSFAKRYGIEEGTKLPRTIIEYCLKSDELSDPVLSEDYIFSYDLAHPIELDEMYQQALRINDLLTGMFLMINIKLVDFKLEFGRMYNEVTGDLHLLLADEISPDGSRLWDITSDEKLDKDRFRRDLGGIEHAYQEVARRLGILGDDNGKVEVAKPVMNKPLHIRKVNI